MAYLFFTAMPALSIFLDYHFVLRASEVHGVVKLLMTNFWAVYAFSFSYFFMIGRSQLAYVSQNTDHNSRVETRRNIAWAIGAGAVGIVSFLVIYTKIGSFDDLRYEQIGVALRGQGWLLRLAELLAVGGALLVVSAFRMKKNKLMIVGVSMLLFYAFLRYPFQNRENVIKYFVMVVFMYFYSSNLKISKAKTLLAVLASVTILFLLPIFSLLRGGEVLGSSYSLTYIDFLFRDFNFAEVAAALYARDELSGFFGIGDGIINIISSLIPRELYPDKPYPLAVIITSYVTAVSNYDVSDPYFSYGTGFMGTMYAMGGVIWVVAFALILGAASGWGMRIFRERCSSGCKVEYKILVGLVMYYLVISIHKLDLANILTAAVLPICFLGLMLTIGRINFRKAP